MAIVIDLLKAKVKKTKGKQRKDLPPGGVWRTINGASVYIKDGKVLAGAGGKLSRLEKRDAQAIYTAREQKQDLGSVIHPGVEVKVGKERKKGVVKKETKTTYHIEYPGGKLRKVGKTQVRRADAKKLEREAKRAQGESPMTLTEGGKPQPISKKREQEHQKAREETGAVARPDESFGSDLVATTKRATPFTSIQAPLLKRDADGNPIKEPKVTAEGEPILDPYTGKQKMGYVYELSDGATEDDLIRDHQGLIYSEIVNPYAKNIALDIIQREWRDHLGNPTDLYGDLVQSANLGFVEGLREYAYNVADGQTPEVDILTHAINRSRQQVRRQARNIFDDVPIPRRIVKPMSLVHRTKETMMKELERQPTDKEVADRLKGNPTFESMHGDTPEEKVANVARVQRLQRMTSVDQTSKRANDRGDKDRTLADTVEDPTAQRRMLAQEDRDRKLDVRRALRKVLRQYLDEREAEFVLTRFRIGSESKNPEPLTVKETAEKMGISEGLGKKTSSRAMKNLQQLPTEALRILRDASATKSLVKELYLQSLEDILGEHGLTIADTDTVYTRSLAGSEQEIHKALDITEFVGNWTHIPGEDGRFRVHCYTHSVPKNLDLLQKSGAGKKAQSPASRHAKLKDYVQNHPEKYKAMAKHQHAEIKRRAKPGGSPPWSVRLQAENPGSIWITWGGNRILINGIRGDVLFDRSVPAHAQREGLEVDSDETEFRGFTWDEDTQEKELEYSMEQQALKFQGDVQTTKDGSVQYYSDKDFPDQKIARRKGGFYDEWLQSKKVKEAFKNAAKKKANKVFPDGSFLLENPKTGKRVVVQVDIVNAGDKKATTEVTYAFDPDGDTSVDIGNWNQIARELGVSEKGNTYENLRKYTNTPEWGTLRPLSEDEYADLRKKTTRGAQEDMVHVDFADVTPETMKVTRRDPKTNKFYSETVPYKGKRIYETRLPDGGKARFEISEDGSFSDPIMQRLINPALPIRNASDLYTALRDGVNNETWVTLSSTKMDHVNHHVKLKYDGQGAPVVVGGAFDGMRFQDASEVTDPKAKKNSLFSGGKLRRTGIKREKVEVPFKRGNTVLVRDRSDGRKWEEATLRKHGRGKSWTLEYGDGMLETKHESNMRHKIEKVPVAQEASVLSESTKDGFLTLTVPKGYRSTYEANFGLVLDNKGRTDISLAKYEEIRDEIGSLSLTKKASDTVDEYHAAKVRSAFPDVDALLEKHHPKTIKGFKANTVAGFDLRETGMYSTQAEAVEHLLSVNKGIAAHGMGTGKTLIGVTAALQDRQRRMKAGETPKKTLIVAPAGIRSEWLKEINGHTDVGAVVLGSKSDAAKGYALGEPGLESPVVSAKELPKNDSHFVVMSYEQYMSNADTLKKQGYDNIIIDEVHAFKTKDGRRNEKVMEMSKEFENVWGLSGTPMDNDVLDIFHVINAVTGGNHDLGTEAEFLDNYTLRKGRKIIGMKTEKIPELGKKVSRYAQFRNGYDDRIASVDPKTGEKHVKVFPKLLGGNPNLYHGAINSAADSTQVTVGDGENRRTINQPNPKNDKERKFYDEYQALERKVLSPEHQEQIADAERSGKDTGKGNYLAAVQTLQQFSNAPLSQQAYAKVTKRKDGKGKNVTSKDYPYEVDNDGFKRYYKTNQAGTDYERDSKGKPVLLPPMHHNNPKADHLRSMINNQLAEHNNEMKRRVEHNKGLKKGEKPLPLYAPKIVVTSQFTRFGAEVVENVFRELSRDTGAEFGAFTGDTAKQRDHLKNQFQNNDNFHFMVISDAGKEGIDLGNAHKLIHYDQDFNPNKMAQKSARILRASSYKHAEREERANEVQLQSCVMPGTIDDAILRIQDRKMRDIRAVEGVVRQVEGEVEDTRAPHYQAGSQRKWARKKSLPIVILLGGDSQ